MQSDIAEREEECNQLRTEISSLVSECQDLDLELKKAEEEGENERKHHKEYGILMKRHANQVKELERMLPLQKELESLHSHMEELKTHSTTFDHFPNQPYTIWQETFEGENFHVLLGDTNYVWV